MRALGILGLVALALMAAGCGDSEDPPAAPATATEQKLDEELLSLVSAAIETSGESDPDVVDYADYVLARGQLGLADDENIYEGSLSSFSSALIYASRPDKPPLVSAIDGSSIQAAANRGVTYGEPSLVVIRTMQPFGEIADALRRDGYEKRGDLLVSPASPSDVAFTVVADAGGGVVVLGDSASFVRDVLANRDAALSTAAELIDEVPGPIRLAQSSDSKCVVAGAAGQNISPREGELLLQVEGTAREGKLNIPEDPMPTGSGEIVLGDVAAEGDEIRVEFTYTDWRNPAIHMLPIDGSTYDC